MARCELQKENWKGNRKILENVHRGKFNFEAFRGISRNIPATCGFGKKTICDSQINGIQDENALSERRKNNQNHAVKGCPRKETLPGNTLPRASFEAVHPAIKNQKFSKNSKMFAFCLEMIENCMVRQSRRANLYVHCKCVSSAAQGGCRSFNLFKARLLDLWTGLSLLVLLSVISIDLSIYLSVFQSTSLKIYLPTYLSFYLSFCLSCYIYLSICLSVYLSVYLSIYVSFDLSIYLSIPSICLSLGL